MILRDFQPHGCSGFCRGSAVEEFEDGCGGTPALLALLKEGEDHLWRDLARELCYSERPHPDPGLSADMTFAV